MYAERTVSARWTLCEHWWSGESTVSVNREKRRAQVNALWAHEKMGQLNFLYLYHGSIGQYHLNNKTSFLLPGWIMGREKWWYWQTFKDNWCHSACLNTIVHNRTVKRQPKNNLHIILYTFLRIYVLILLLHTCYTTAFEFPR